MFERVNRNYTVNFRIEQKKCYTYTEKNGDHENTDDY